MINNYKIGIVIPTCSPERKEMLGWVMDRMKRQTTPPDYIALMDYTKIRKGPDLAERYKNGIKDCFERGCDFVLFIEDDDYYPIDYIETMFSHWIQNNKPHVIGCNETTYYHIFSRGWQNMKTSEHASAHGTAVGRGVDIDSCNDGNLYFDIEIWKRNSKNCKLIYFPNHCISIKHGIGLCGGGGHLKTRYRNQDDEQYTKLRELLDEDGFTFYTTLVKKETLPEVIKDPQWDSIRTGLQYSEINKDICLLFYPDENKPSPLSRIRKVCEKRNIPFHNDPNKHHTHHFYWSYHPAKRFHDSVTSNAKNVINFGCWDITKKKVNDIFNDISINPRTFNGVAVEKIERQGAHDSHNLVNCPCNPRPGYIYQRLLVDEECVGDTKYWVKYRIYYADGIGFILKQVKKSLFGSDYVKEYIVPTRDYFTEEMELDFMVKCMKFGVDCGEIDFVMDNGVPIIIDVNNVAGIVESTPDIEQARENLIVNFLNHRKGFME